MVRQLQPWHENLNKRQVKSTKVYFRDSALSHLFAIYPGAHRDAADEEITMWPVQDIPDMKSWIEGRS